jgi:hypothetical protein
MTIYSSKINHFYSHSSLGIGPTSTLFILRHLPVSRSPHQWLTSRFAFEYRNASLSNLDYGPTSPTTLPSRARYLGPPRYYPDIFVVFLSVPGHNFQYRRPSLH